MGQQPRTTNIDKLRNRILFLIAAMNINLSGHVASFARGLVASFIRGVPASSPRDDSQVSSRRAHAAHASRISRWDGGQILLSDPFPEDARMMLGDPYDRTRVARMPPRGEGAALTGGSCGWICADERPCRLISSRLIARAR